MTRKYSPELVFLLTVIALGLIGFSSLSRSEYPALTAYHYLHISTSLAWLLLLLGQLVAVRQNRFDLHRTIGTSIFFAGPVLVASLTLLTVHSAANDAAADQADDLLVQNVGVTAEMALLVFLAFLLRQNRNLHGALLMSTSLLFMGIAMFFTLISYVPGYRIEGGEIETSSRFADAGQAISIVCFVIGLLFFLRNWRTAWPWLFAGSSFTVNAFLQMYLDQTGRTKPLTIVVASIGRAPAFGLSLLIFGALLWMAWRVVPAKRPKPLAVRMAGRA